MHYVTLVCCLAVLRTIYQTTPLCCQGRFEVLDVQLPINTIVSLAVGDSRFSLFQTKISDTQQSAIHLNSVATWWLAISTSLQRNFCPCGFSDTQLLYSAQSVTHTLGCPAGLSGPGTRQVCFYSDGLQKWPSNWAHRCDRVSTLLHWILWNEAVGQAAFFFLQMFLYGNTEGIVDHWTCV